MLNDLYYFLLINLHTYSNKGLNYIFQTRNSEEWRSLFDAIIVSNILKNLY